MSLLRCFQSGWRQGVLTTTNVLLKDRLGFFKSVLIQYSQILVLKQLLVAVSSYHRLYIKIFIYSLCSYCPYWLLFELFLTRLQWSWYKVLAVWINQINKVFSKVSPFSIKFPFILLSLAAHRGNIVWGNTKRNFILKRLWKIPRSFDSYYVLLNFKMHFYTESGLWISHLTTYCTLELCLSAGHLCKKTEMKWSSERKYCFCNNQACVYFSICVSKCAHKLHIPHFLHFPWKTPWCIGHVFSRTWLSCTVVFYICDLLTSISSNQVIQYIFRYSSSVPVGCQTQVKFCAAALNEVWLFGGCMFVALCREWKISGDKPQIISDVNQLPQSICCGNIETHCFNKKAALKMKNIPIYVLIFGVCILVCLVSAKTHSVMLK